MILSVSRRSDIPNYYSDWFYNRIKEGFLYVKNPMNHNQVSKIYLSPEVVDCIVFWTKNPKRMISRLDELKEYQYYFQFSLTGYGKDIEPAVPHKRNEMISTFQELSRKVGAYRVIWRYDPIMLNSTYTIDYHLRAFEAIAKELKDYSKKVIISFIDFYLKIKKNIELLNITAPSDQDMITLCSNLSKIAKENGFQIEACAQQQDFTPYGIKSANCVDRDLVEKLIGYELKGKKDRNQRKECGCMESIDIGTYDTCPNGCKYCYANFNDARLRTTISLYDKNSPLLCSNVTDKMIIKERVVKSLKL